MGIVENELDEEVKVNHDDKIVHLQLIQGVIDRMATSAAIYKGFVATIVTGIAAISFTDVRSRVLLVAFLPVICFLAMDTYYLQLEKKYRILYEKVRTETIIPDFALNPYCTDDELKKNHATVWDCLRSPSIRMFYGPIIVLADVVLVLNYIGVI